MVVITRCDPGSEALLGQEVTDSAPGISCQVPVDCSFCPLAANLASQVNVVV